MDFLVSANAAFETNKIASNCFQLLPILDYATYMQSPEWADRKRRYYQDFGRMCAICDTHHHIELNHLSYKNLGNEPDDDLVAVCRFHHEVFHKRYGVARDMHRQWGEFLMYTTKQWL